MDMNLNRTYLSPSITRMLGYTVEQSLTGRIDTRLTPDSAAAAQKAFADAMSRDARQPDGQRDEPQIDLEFIRSDGSTVWTSAKVTVVRGADGKPLAILGVLRDITERKKAEDSLR